MQFFKKALVALWSASVFSFAAAQSNPFSIPPSGLSATGGQPLHLSWKPTTQGTVTLVLRSGSSNDLSEGMVIVSGYANSGNYTWVPSNSIVKGTDYTVEIVDDSDTSNTNYTPYFTIDTTTTSSATVTMSKVTLGAPSGTVKQSTASATGSATSVTAPVSKESTASAASSAASSGSSAASGSSGSASGSSAASTTAGSSASGSSAATAASSQATAASASAGSGARATAAVGLLGAVALGALAL